VCEVTQADSSDTKNASTPVTNATLSLNDQKHLENTIIFLPNVWSLMPNSVEYQKLVDEYKAFIENPPVDVGVAKANVEAKRSAETTVDKPEIVENKKPSEKNTPEAKSPVAVVNDQESAMPMEQEQTLTELAKPIKEETNDTKPKALKKICCLK